MLSATFALLAVSAVQAADYPVFETVLHSHLHEALHALETHRYLDFELSRLQVERDMANLAEVLRGDALVQVHLVYTARAWLDGDEQGLVAGLRGLRKVSPGFTLPQGWTEGNGRLEALYLEAVNAGYGPDARLPSHLVVDGRMATDHLPIERSTVVQIRNPGGSWTSWYVQPGEPTATWLTARAVVEARPTTPAAPVPVPSGDIEVDPED